MDGDYVVNYIGWAQARDADVPEGLLNRWLEARQAKGGFDLADYIEMTQLSDSKVDTLMTVFGRSRTLSELHRYAIRLLGVLTPKEIRIAFSPDGIEMTRLSAQHVTTLQKIFKRTEVTLPVRVRLAHYKGKDGSDSIDITYSDAKGEAYPRSCEIGTSGGDSTGTNIRPVDGFQK